jgi:hypothetical protein
MWIVLGDGEDRNWLREASQCSRPQRGERHRVPYLGGRRRIDQDLAVFGRGAEP